MLGRYAAVSLPYKIIQVVILPFLRKNPDIVHNYRKNNSQKEKITSYIFSTDVFYTCPPSGFLKRLSR